MSADLKGTLVSIHADRDTIRFTVEGWHKLWALRDGVVVRRDQITAVRHDPDAASGWHGWRLPGTHVTGVIVAGQFRRRGEWVFYDVVDRERTVVVELTGHRFARLVVEVADVPIALEALRTEVPG